jgi:ADP-L-glycero-D-manno-heptose 6-epimerase
MSYHVVTGAAGFIGSRLVAALNRRGVRNHRRRQSHAKQQVHQPCRLYIADYVDQAQFIAKLDRWRAPSKPSSIRRVLRHHGGDGRFMMENNYVFAAIARLVPGNGAVIYASSVSCTARALSSARSGAARPLNVYGYSSFSSTST